LYPIFYFEVVQAVLYSTMTCNTVFLYPVFDFEVA
jgi:hypothetical protein